MHEIIAKVARFAVSKFAAFCYAVAVGVVGNLALNVVQQHHSSPAPALHVGEATGVGSAVNQAAAPAVAAKPPSHGGSDTAPIRPLPATPSLATRQAGPGTAVPALPEPPAISLPSPAALPAPAFRPAVLPSEAATEPAAKPPAATALMSPDAATGAVVRPSPLPGEVPLDGASAGDASAPASPPVAGLPPLAPAIDVAAPPTPPAPTPVALPRATAARTAPPDEASGSLKFSDVWHPGRVVEHGLHWAGRQVPLIGDSAPEPHAGAAKPSAPIPLLPPTAASASSSGSDAVLSPGRGAAPGPGHGGLY